MHSSDTVPPPAARLATRCTPGIAPPAQGATRLYRFLAGTTAGSWEVVANNAELNLYDANEDSASKAPEWHLEVDGAQEAVDTRVDDNFSFEPKDSRVTFVAGEDIWALKFGGIAAFERFLQRYNKAMFENRFGVESSEANEVKVSWRQQQQQQRKQPCMLE